MNKKKKKGLLILILFLLLISLVFGVSYAIFSYYRNGSKTNQFYTADIMYRVNEIENFVLDKVFPESYEYGTTQDDDVVSFSINGNIQTGVLDYTIGVIRGDDITGKQRIPDDAIMVAISSLDESNVFETVDFNSESLNNTKISAKSLSDLQNSDITTLATGFLTPASSIEHESFYVRIWVSDEKVMISDTICRNETTKKADNCNTSYVDDDGDTIYTYPYENAYTNNMYIFRTNEIQNMYYSIKIKIDSNL